MKKKNKKMNTYKYDNKRFILVFTMMFCLVISMSTYWIFAYKNKYGYLHINDKIISYKVSDYAYVDGNIIYLKNIDNKIANDFKDKQLDIIKNNDMDSIYYKNKPERTIALTDCIKKIFTNEKAIIVKKFLPLMLT